MRFDPVECGKRIKSLSEEKGFTQMELAEELNITLNHLKAIENARRACSIDLLVELHLFFEVSLDYLILGKTMKTDYIQSEIDDAIKILIRLKEGV